VREHENYKRDEKRAEENKTEQGGRRGLKRDRKAEVNRRASEGKTRKNER
jgi:hypothetical protein